jgi:hypothetical protein
MKISHFPTDILEQIFDFISYEDVTTCYFTGECLFRSKIEKTPVDKVGQFTDYIGVERSSSYYVVDDDVDVRSVAWNFRCSMRMENSASSESGGLSDKVNYREYKYKSSSRQFYKFAIKKNYLPKFCRISDFNPSRSLRKLELSYNLSCLERISSVICQLPSLAEVEIDQLQMKRFEYRALNSPATGFKSPYMRTDDSFYLPLLPPTVEILKSTACRQSDVERLPTSITTLILPYSFSLDLSRFTDLTRLEVSNFLCEVPSSVISLKVGISSDIALEKLLASSTLYLEELECRDCVFKEWKKIKSFDSYGFNFKEREEKCQFGLCYTI